MLGDIGQILHAELNPSSMSGPVPKEWRHELDISMFPCDHNDFCDDRLKHICPGWAPVREADGRVYLDVVRVRAAAADGQRLCSRARPSKDRRRPQRRLQRPAREWNLWVKILGPAFMDGACVAAVSSETCISLTHTAQCLTSL